MAPNIRAQLAGELRPIETNNLTDKPTVPFKTIIVWRNVFLFALLHLASLYGIYLFITKAMWQTIIFS